MLTGSGNLVTDQNENKFSVPSLKFLHKGKNKEKQGEKSFLKSL